MKHNCKTFLAFVAILALVSLPTPSTSQGDNTALPATIPPIVINNQQAICPPAETVREDFDQDIRNSIRDTIIPTLCLLGQTQSSPVASCSALPTSCSSGYYWVTSSNGTAVQVYCDMDRVCGCSSTGGWTRVANLNMSNPSEQCPGEWILQTYSTEPMRLCGRASTGTGCLSATYNTYGISYSHICGRMTGYQYASVDAFYSNSIEMLTIDSYYVDGVSITHGPAGSRQHIWTFAAGVSEPGQAAHSNSECPCADRGSRAYIPSFVGNDFFCESGNPGQWTYVLYSSDPLWDGQGCGSPPCCELSYPPGVTAPWFCKQLPQATTNDVEVRICGLVDSAEDTPVELVELYIR